jgi:D-aspartate ligase
MTITQNPRLRREPEDYPSSSPQRTRPAEAAGAQRPPVLLTSSRYLGTLAAARSFGRAGVPSVVADDSRLGPASWSRFVTRRLTCPPDSQPEQLLEWLLAYGKANPGHVLCATSDESAWLYSKHRDELGQYFHMYQPSVDAVYSLLNKRRLCEIARAEQVDVPRTWFPQSEAELQEVLKEARLPVLTKPVTQILHKTHTKGAVIDEAAEVARFFLFMANEMHQPELLAADPSVRCPMVQEFQLASAQGVHSISGFIDESGTVLGVRGTKKILQRPRRLGVGLCFERAEVKPSLVDAISRICRRVGYYGVFEVEFIHSDGKDLLIDFNPRFYGQMAFDVGRGLPVPLLVYHAALGETRTVNALAERARQPGVEDAKAVLCHLIDFELLLRGQRLSGAMSAEDVKVWRDWYATYRDRMVHPIRDRDDWKPFAIEIMRQVLHHLRHPRAALRSSMLRAVLLGIHLHQRSV